MQCRNWGPSKDKSSDRMRGRLGGVGTMDSIVGGPIWQAKGLWLVFGWRWVGGLKKRAGCPIKVSGRGGIWLVFSYLLLNFGKRKHITKNRNCDEGSLLKVGSEDCKGERREGKVEECSDSL